MLVSFFLFSISFINAELIIPVGKATKPIPSRAINPEINLPNPVTGKISPYPTVVRVATAHQKPCPIF